MTFSKQNKTEELCACISDGNNGQQPSLVYKLHELDLYCFQTYPVTLLLNEIWKWIGYLWAEPAEIIRCMCRSMCKLYLWPWGKLSVKTRPKIVTAQGRGQRSAAAVSGWPEKDHEGHSHPTPETIFEQRLWWWWDDDLSYNDCLRHIILNWNNRRQDDMFVPLDLHTVCVFVSNADKLLVYITMDVLDWILF